MAGRKGVLIERFHLIVMSRLLHGVLHNIRVLGEGSVDRRSQ